MKRQNPLRYARAIAATEGVIWAERYLCWGPPAEAGPDVAGPADDYSGAAAAAAAVAAAAASRRACWLLSPTIL